MKSDRDIANDILARAIEGDIDAANSGLSAALGTRRESPFRVHSAKYLVVVFCLVVLCLGIDAMDGHIIDHL